MIVLDTNVMSELMRRLPDATVLDWLDRQPRQSLWTSSVSAFELQVGLEKLAAGKRKQSLIDGLARLLNVVLEGRVLFFDLEAANAAAAIVGRQRAAGRPAGIVDTQIAGIVASRRATLATRNTRHFQDAGIKLVDPWSADDR